MQVPVKVIIVNQKGIEALNVSKFDPTINEQ
jgi:hypothetical protein